MTIPIMVEANVRVLQAEVEKLRHTDGPHSRTFAAGAIATINWLLKGEPRPSDSLLFIKSHD